LEIHPDKTGGLELSTKAFQIVQSAIREIEKYVKVSKGFVPACFGTDTIHVKGY